MTHKNALAELLKISELTHPDGNYSRMMLQKAALEDWFNKWLIEVGAEETVLHKQYLTSEFKDFIREKLVYSLVEKLTEDCAEFKEKDRTTKVRMYALRRQDKP